MYFFRLSASALLALIGEWFAVMEAGYNLAGWCNFTGWLPLLCLRKPARGFVVMDVGASFAGRCNFFFSAAGLCFAAQIGEWFHFNGSGRKLCCKM